MTETLNNFKTIKITTRAQSRRNKPPIKPWKIYNFQVSQIMTKSKAGTISMTHITTTEAPSRLKEANTKDSTHTKTIPHHMSLFPTRSLAPVMFLSPMTVTILSRVLMCTRLMIKNMKTTKINKSMSNSMLTKPIMYRVLNKMESQTFIKRLNPLNLIKKSQTSFNPLPTTFILKRQRNDLINKKNALIPQKLIKFDQNKSQSWKLEKL